MKENKHLNYSDVILIGSGIMSATLGTFLKKLEPQWTINIFERIDKVAMESSEAWNNAGTGHSAFCELNYTPEKPDGSINIDKAISIAQSFEVSKEFWASLVEQGIIKEPSDIISHMPHISFVWGEDNIRFLRKRYDALTQHVLFKGMQYSENPNEISEWIPLVMEGRDPTQKIAATRMDIGTDVNFGTLSRLMIDFLEQDEKVHLKLHHEVQDIRRLDNELWQIEVKDLETGEETRYTTAFIFIGAGGGSLPLLEKSDIPEGRGYGGFPISGQWLVCKNPHLIAQHYSKVYGKAKIGAPPMSVPHLDTRFIDGKRSLLFGPFAGFSTKFLKHGSYMDLPLSVKWDNIKPLLSAGIHNIPLTKYLINEVRQSPEDRLEALIHYFPSAKMEDWVLQKAGQRVQVIKKDEEEGGILEFGTEVVYAQDGSLATLLGASPGASTSVSIMLDVLDKCFPELMGMTSWKNEIKNLIPTYGLSLAADEQLCILTRRSTAHILGLNTHEHFQSPPQYSTISKG